jgi:nicotinate phosphoribosyltransferase
MYSPLLTDFYQITMAYGYWKSGMKDHEAIFQLYFRKLPFGGGFALACGLENALEYLEAYRFSPEDLAYLGELRNPAGEALFEAGFLEYLSGLRANIRLEALEEGLPVFPGEPMLRLSGPLILGQLLETPLLNLINFQTLVATKAARICLAADGAPVLEFGLRRAQGPDGGLSASRAAYIGGCQASSHVLAGQRYGLPIRGTHAHSWVMSFEEEAEAFAAYAAALSHNVIFLVDTYDTLQGVRHAISEGLRLRERGYRLGGIRLDSGNLLSLSRQARQLLDEAGLADTAIVATNDLDEHEIARLRAAGAPIDSWGVGTRLVAAWDQPALGGVYKMAALRAPGGPWKPRFKRSDDPAKASLPGALALFRYGSGGQWLGDCLAEEGEAAPASFRTGDGRIFDAAGLEAESLLRPVFEGGRRLQPPADIHALRARAQDQLRRLPPACLALREPQPYPLGLSEALRRKAASAG